MARRLGVSHAAPYKHHASRDHLLAELIRRCFMHFAKALDARERHDEARAELHELGRCYPACAEQHALAPAQPTPAAAPRHKR